MGAAAAHFELLHQTGLVHHPVVIIVLLVQVKAVDFLFRHQHLAVAGLIDLECLAAAQRYDLLTRIVLRQLQVPAKTKAAVLTVERIIVECQWHARATQPVGFDIGQGDRHCVLPGAGVNAALYITEEVERVGVY
ncbi:hypothetical protein [Pseudomonas ficuserectae]|uniref:hypothetical protein n=1 Tax=Pseudomonas ficuserectae TaxID=53410 RepID=UPI00211BD7AC|nr:hypothetical protein [Pseudomonas ficuserectae]